MSRFFSLTPPNLFSRQPAISSLYSELTLGKGLIINSIYSLSSPKPVYRHLLLIDRHSSWSIVALVNGRRLISHSSTHLPWFVNIMEAATFDTMSCLFMFIVLILTPMFLHRNHTTLKSLKTTHTHFTLHVTFLSHVPTVIYIHFVEAEKFLESIRFQ